MVIEWTPAMAVGVPEIDGQLAEVFGLAGRLVLALRSGRGPQAARLAASLGDCASRHFAAEERLMARACYPGLARHAAEHEAFRAACRERAAEVARSGATPPLALAIHNWLSDWLRAHVGGADAELGRFLGARRDLQRR